MPKLTFVAGDPSGDAHAAELIAALKQRDPSLAFFGLGGPKMQQAGMPLLTDLTQAAAIGPFDAARHIGHLQKAKKLLAAHLETEKPDAVILVDFGDYNLPIIAPLVKRAGIPVIYFISPQLWAWGRWRLRYVQRYVDHMLVFFGFEEKLYRQAGVAVTWVGHPLAGQVQRTLSREAALQQLGLNPWRMTVGLLPGSREKEIGRHLPVMLAAARQLAWHMPGLQFVLPIAKGLSRQRIEALSANADIDLHLAEGTGEALHVMDGAIVSSGTATLEAALAKVPMVVIYRTSWPTYLLARLVLRIPDIALVNIVLQKRTVPELIQHQASTKRIAQALLPLLRQETKRKTVVEALGQVEAQLGKPGAIENAAEAILTLLKRKRA